MAPSDFKATEILATDVPHPFSCYASSTQLNPDAFASIDGKGPYEKYTWSANGEDFGVDIEDGSAVPFEASCELFDNHDAITLVFWTENCGYRYPKTHFALITTEAQLNSGLSDLLERYNIPLSGCELLAILPVSRLQLEDYEIEYPGNVTFYQQGELALDELNCVSSDRFGHPIAQAASALTQVDLSTFSDHTLVAVPVRIAWEQFLAASHKEHLELISRISQEVDRACFDYVTYRLCDFYPVDSLPGRVGSLDTQPMFAAALIYDPKSNTSHMVSGSVFTHAVVKGIGLCLAPLSAHSFPKDGEVGRIVKHALTLYRGLLDSTSLTSQFVQAMSLLEFLAFPDDYRPFKEVKKIVAFHAAKSEYEYKAILDRFFELTGKKDPVSNKHVGYRTRIVHLGQRIEDIVPHETDRKKLFQEIYGYIKAMMDHMIDHSELALTEYVEIRKRLNRFSA